MYSDVRAINDLVERESAFVDGILHEVRKVIVGQEQMVERMLIGLFTGGHVLLEGVPGLAKTLTVKTLCDTISAKFQRIQFTPDLLPADLVGTVIYNQQRGDFSAKKGPIFANLVLADEINRAPAKVQSALLEAMQERQVTIGETTYPLDRPFMVMATQNPLEQEGTYPLPEAQVDRFMMHVRVDYPTREQEREIMERMTDSVLKEGLETRAGREVAAASPPSGASPRRVGGSSPLPPSPLPAGARSSRPQRAPAPSGSPPNPLRVKRMVGSREILQARRTIGHVYADDKIKDYIIDVVTASRDTARVGLRDLQDMVAHGASPRASIALNLASRAHAFLKHRGFVTPEDVKAVGPDVLRHRIIRTYEAEAEEISSDQIVRRIFEAVEVP